MKLTRPNYIDLRKVFLQSVKLPIVLLLIGVFLSSLIYVAPFFKLNHQWQGMLNVANDMGSVFMTLSWIIFIYLALFSILKSYEKSLFADNKKTLTHILATTRKGLRIIFILFALDAIFTIFELKYQYPKIFQKITAVFIIASVAWLFLQIIATLELVFYNQYTAHSSDEMHKRVGFNYTKIRQIRNIASILVVVIAISATLMLFDQVRSLGISILASATFLTAILAFSAQRTLGSMFAGIQLAFSKRIQIGDALTIEHENGVVEEINLSYVVIKITDARRLVLPVSYFLEKAFHNWSLNNEELQGSFKIFVDYLFPVDALRVELNRIINESNFWDKKIVTLVVSDIKENVVELRINVSATTYTQLDNLKVELRERLLAFISKNYPDYFPRVRNINSVST